jgi:hypothetical protein
MMENDLAVSIGFCIYQPSSAITCLYVGDKSEQAEMLAPSILLPLSPLFACKNSAIYATSKNISVRSTNVQFKIVWTFFFKKRKSDELMSSFHYSFNSINWTNERQYIRIGEKVQRMAETCVTVNSRKFPFMCPIISAIGLNHPLKDCGRDGVWNILRATHLDGQTLVKRIKRTNEWTEA